MTRELLSDDRSKVEIYIDQVLPSDRLDDLARSLPEHIKPALFKRNLLNVLMTSPQLMKHEPGYIFREVSRAAGLGLLLDPHLGEAYMVEAYDYREKRALPQLRVGYRGLTKLARQSGTVSQIYAHEVCRNDAIECELGAEKALRHKPILFSDRGPVIGYYAVALYRDGGFDFEPMSAEQINGIRDRSDAWKAYSEKKIRSTPWSTDPDEMAKKTVIRRLAKRLPQSPEMAEALRLEDHAEGYIADREPASRRVAPVPPAARAITNAPLPQQSGDGEQRPAPVKADQSVALNTSASTRQPPIPPGSKPQDAAQPGSWNAVFKAWKVHSGQAADVEQLGKVWDQHVEPYFDNFGPDDQDELLRLNRMRAAELGGQEGAEP